MTFHEIIIRSRADQLDSQQYESTELDREGIAMFAQMLRDHGRSFRQPIPIEDYQHIELLWSSEPAATGFAIFYSRLQVAMVSVLAGGRDPDADRQAILKLPSMAAAPLGMGGRRPLSASIPSTNPEVSVDLAPIDGMNRCLAAAFFESESLAEG